MTPEAVIAANRFGLGARPGELQRIGTGAREWLLAQIKGTRAAPEAMQALPSSPRVFKLYAQGLMDRREAKQQPTQDKARDVLASIRQTLAPLYLDQVAARYRTATQAQESFRERLVHFWTNHFAVSADKPAVTALAATLENEAVRPNVAARFADLLMAVESHPAMILYLDNQASIGPGSQLAQRAARRRAKGAGNGVRQRGINENLAREILELHTLGVNGGYTQADVTTFAHALTGWSVAGNRGAPLRGEPGTFEFYELVHEPGAKTILGKRYPDEGVAQPRAVLNDLARHPSTAQHVATKLVRHFVADEPPAAVVERVAKAFRDSDGDLPTVYQALIDAPQAWSPTAVKLKTPHEFAVSTLRMLDSVPQSPQQILAPFQLLGQRPYTPGSPAGWPDTADQWDGSDALLRRIEWASAVGARVGTQLQPLRLAAQSLGEALTERTRTAISRAASTAQGITLLLVSPDFQRR